MSFKNTLYVIFVFSLFFSCATVQNRKTEKNFTEKILNMKPLKIFAGENTTTDLSPKELFEKAEDLSDEGNFNKALYYYFVLIKHYPDSGYVSMALFNIAAIMEEKKEIEKAIKIYKYIVRHLPSTPLYNRSLFRLALLSESEGKYSEGLKFLNQIKSSKLGYEDKLKIRVLKGILLVESGDKDKGSFILEQADLEYMKLRREKKPFDNYFWGWERFVLAELVFNKFNNSKVTHRQQELMRKELEKKAEYLLDCQRLYFKTIKTGSAYWASAAVYKIGLLYEYFYLEVAAIKPPDSLNEEEKKVYYEELHKIMTPVINKAITAYKKIIYYAGMWGLNSEWVEKARRHLEILEELNKKFI